MKISANDIRIGNVIFHDNRYLVVSKTMHTQPGKGGAYIQVEMKEIKTGTKMNHRFRSSEDVERIKLDQQPHQFLYEEGDGLVLMDQETYEQRTVPQSLLGEQASFLQEGMVVILETHDGEPLVASLPSTAEVVVKECEPVVKGQTSASSYKPAVLENGARIMVPPFINEGDKIVVDIKELKYLERAK
ncbi:elongation factor P [Candidatus Bandiella euplotis]|uniref:Elongation factor P n=1 Tax=Candidatus Bandiella euplotis TaxID=1664265 RepID=A0ABZ0ULN1_9RICK|nr:elongation factor P [Candidatus Bandiella woodruffii]WPX96852.1 Elongation factor P [Candidatus Bandiella woodruffii]